MAASAPPAEIVPLKTDPKYDDYDFPTISATNQSGHAGHLTPEQEAQVYQLRMSLEQKGFTDRLDTLTLVCCCRCPLSPLSGEGNPWLLY